MANSYSKLAEYFERRAARARNPDQRAHYLEIAKKYRRLAARGDEPPTPQPPASAEGSGKKPKRR
jgi:hypothetical protein